MFRIKSSLASLSLPHVIQRALLTLVICLPLTADGLRAAVSAQSATASLSGTVEDEKGAVIAGATVIAINVNTNSRRQVTTNESGSFMIPFLAPSAYIVRVESQGFTPIEVKDVALNVNDQRSLPSRR